LPGEVEMRKVGDTVSNSVVEGLRRSGRSDVKPFSNGIEGKYESKYEYMGGSCSHVVPVMPSVPVSKVAESASGGMSTPPPSYRPVDSAANRNMVPATTDLSPRSAGNVPLDPIIQQAVQIHKVTPVADRSGATPRAANSSARYQPLGSAYAPMHTLTEATATDPRVPPLCLGASLPAAPAAERGAGSARGKTGEGGAGSACGKTGEGGAGSARGKTGEGGAGSARSNTGRSPRLPSQYCIPLGQA
jgi:hypothetical protein